jgi:hypothetical protein
MAANTHSCDFETTSTSQYAWKDNPTGLDITGDMTVEAWIKAESLTAAITICSMDYPDEEEASNTLFNLVIDTAGKIRWLHEYSTGSNELQTSVSAYITIGTWSYVAVSRNSSTKKLRIYINGAYKEELSYTNNATGGSDADFKVGVSQAFGTEAFDGLIDELRIWNDVRTDDEIAANYKKDVTGETGLVGYWKLNNNYTDATGTNDLTAGAGGAAPAFSTTVSFPTYEVDNGITNSYSLNLEPSSSQYAYIADADQTGLDFTSTFTLEGWFYFESLPADGQYMHLINKYYDGTDNAYCFFVGNASGEYRLFSMISESADNTTRDLAYVVITPSIGTWYHYAVTCNVANASATTFEFFVNGVSAGNGTLSLGNNCTSINSNDEKFIIGCIYNGSYVYLFDGKVDEVRAWSTVRTASQIEQNLYTDVTGQTGLQGYWKFNNGVTDSSPNGNTLTLSGTPIYSAVVAFANYLATSGGLFLLNFI